MSILNKFTSSRKEKAEERQPSLDANPATKPKRPVRGFQIRNGADKNTVSIGEGATFRGENIIDFWRNSSDNTIKIGNNFSCNHLKVVFKGSGSSLVVDDNVTWVGHILIVGDNRSVRIGKNSTAQGVYILSRGADVLIGQDCMLSREIEIRSTDVHKIVCLDSGELLNPASPITIADRVWIAAKSIVSKGAIIPAGCVVGAGAFVNKQFTQENTIIAGIPAKVVKTNIRWER